MENRSFFFPWLIWMILSQVWQVSPQTPAGFYRFGLDLYRALKLVKPFKNRFFYIQLLLMLEIRLSPVEFGSLSPIFFKGFIHLRWLFGISAINSRTPSLRSILSSIHQKLNGTKSQRTPFRKLRDRAIRYSSFFGVRSVGPVGDFLDINLTSLYIHVYLKRGISIQTC